MMNAPKGFIHHRDKFLGRISNIYNHILPKHSIFREDWNNMIILDACRYDYFKKAIKKIDIKGKLQKTFSIASHTLPFILNTFTKDKYDDIVCISTNPYIDREVGHKFHDCIPVWKDIWATVYGGTVIPTDIIPFVLNATIKYPNKRLLIWFVQPHSPYLFHELNPNGVYMGRYSYEILKIYKMFFWAYLPVSELRRRYMDNLLLVLKTCKRVLRMLHGKTIISSDHAECLGHFYPFTPFRVYGHYKDVRTPSMYKVPYFICD